MSWPEPYERYAEKLCRYYRQVFLSPQIECEDYSDFIHLARIAVWEAAQAVGPDRPAASVVQDPTFRTAARTQLSTLLRGYGTQAKDQELRGKFRRPTTFEWDTWAFCAPTGAALTVVNHSDMIGTDYNSSRTDQPIRRQDVYKFRLLNLPETELSFEHYDQWTFDELLQLLEQELRPSEFKIIEMIHRQGLRLCDIANQQILAHPHYSERRHKSMYQRASRRVREQYLRALHRACQVLRQLPPRPTKVATAA